MAPIIKYAGREETGLSEWTVSFDLVEDAGSVKRYWCKVRLGEYWPGSDEPTFWAYTAYLGAKSIENRVIVSESSGEIYDLSDEAAERAKSPSRGMVEPRVGQVCGRFGSPPYADDTSDDAFQAR
jgi:hypothetical protein